MRGRMDPHSVVGIRRAGAPARCDCCGRELPSDRDRIEAGDRRVVCPACYRGAAFPDAVRSCPEHWSE